MCVPSDTIAVKFCNNILWSIVSKALDRSINISILKVLLSVPLDILYVSFIRVM